MIKVYLGIMSLIRVLCHLFFIYISFTAIQSLRLDRFFNSDQQRGIQILIVLLAISVGYLTGEFFLSFIDNVRNFTYFVK